MGDDDKNSRLALPPRAAQRSGLAALGVTLLLAGTAGAQVVRYVDASRPPGGDGLTWSTACKDLQAALAQGAATEIRVAQGAYRPDSATNDRAARFTLRNNLIVRGGYAGAADSDPNQNNPALFPTTLSGDLGAPGATSDNSYRVVVGSALDSTAVLENVAITGGNADGASPNGAGAALHLTGSSLSSGPTIRNVRFMQNSASSGGAVYMSLTMPMFEGCLFANNFAIGNGGAMQGVNAAPKLDDCVFTSNTAQTGGAISLVFCNSIIRHTTFQDNLAQIGGGALHANLGSLRVEDSLFTANKVLSGFSSADGGGGFYFDHVVSAVVVRTRAIANTSYRGGGAGSISCGTSDAAVISGCRFFENTAATDGGALLLAGGSPKLQNAVFSGNLALTKGGAIHVNNANPNAAFCTFFSNVAQTVSGGAINVGSGNLTLSNSILWSNRNTAGVTEVAQVNDPAKHVGIFASCMQYWTGQYSGTENIAQPPLFKNAAGADGVAGTSDDDLRLAPNSPAIDAGDSALVPPDLADADANGSTTEPLPVDCDLYLRRVDAPQAAGAGLGVQPEPDMGAFEYRCPVDVNADGMTDLTDFFQFLNDFDSGDIGADVNDDSEVDLEDFFLFLNSFDSNCAA